MLWRMHGNPLTNYPIPEDFTAAVNAGIAIVGTPEEVCDRLRREIDAAGVNYVLTRFRVRRSHARGVGAFAVAVHGESHA